ncbi:hypothetical protein J437_LFUL014307 [Ladona fulva]|uniref:MICOS complex subunit MIC13 n=1 Tax=Ladona fulva TaxID=123851 RepID=A0A8K0P673_LADFU|nr:hypothetical protein J437_LFUL014307 [Ladona fulva]
MNHSRTKLKYISNYQYSSFATKPPKKQECKYENDDKICLPKKRCVPSITVCHTLPKQKCGFDAAPSNPNNPCSPCYSAPEKVPPSNLKDLKKLAFEEQLSPPLKMAYRFLKFNVKAIIAGGSIFLTAKYGVWGNSDQTAELYGKTRNNIAALMKENSIPAIDVPDSPEIISTCKHYWNKGVITTINAMIALPSNVSKWSHQVYEYAANNLSKENKPNP